MIYGNTLKLFYNNVQMTYRIITKEILQSLWFAFKFLMCAILPTSLYRNPSPRIHDKQPSHVQYPVGSSDQTNAKVPD